MNRRSRFRRLGLISGLGALAGIAFIAAPSQRALAQTSCTDCYVVTPVTAPATAGAGTGENYSFQVTNNDASETLQNLTFTAPADFVVTGASGPSGTSVSALPSSGVTLNLPSEPAGSTFTVDVTALAPCVTAGSELWGVSGTDSLGETNEVQWSSSPLSVSLTGQCSLQFTGQPAQTAVNSHILTGFDTSGGPLTVQLVDANTEPLNPADFSANGTAVMASIQTNPDAGMLSGMTTETSVNGVASFGDLQISEAGAGYQLAANATGFTQATSNFFTITDQIQACGTGSCSASASTATTTVTATTTAPGDFLAVGLGGANFTCNSYNAVSGVASFGVFDSSGASVASAKITVTLTVSASLAQSVHRPLPLWHICYASQTPFQAIVHSSGTTVISGLTYQTGLLLPCSPPSHPAPCMQSVQSDQAGDVVITFDALGDPFGHG